MVLEYEALHEEMLEENRHGGIFGLKKTIMYLKKQ